MTILECYNAALDERAAAMRVKAGTIHWALDTLRTQEAEGDE